MYDHFIFIIVFFEPDFQYDARISAILS